MNKWEIIIWGAVCIIFFILWIPDLIRNRKTAQYVKEIHEKVVRNGMQDKRQSFQQKRIWEYRLGRRKKRRKK